MGNVQLNTGYYEISTKLPLLNTKRSDITPLLKVKWVKRLPVILNKISLDKKTDQSETIPKTFKKLFETNHIIKNARRTPKKTRHYRRRWIGIGSGQFTSDTR